MLRAVLVKVDGGPRMCAFSFDANHHPWSKTVVHDTLAHDETQLFGARGTNRWRGARAEGPSFGEVGTSTHETVIFQ